jgi:site-specific recombinase XerD
VVQKAVKQAMAKAQINKAASCHSFLHSFAPHFLERSQDIRTTMVYTHVLNRGSLGVRSTADLL